MRSLGSVCIIVTGWTAGVIFPVGVRDFFFSTASRPSLGHTQSGDFNPGGKVTGGETDILPPSSAEVKNSGTTLPHLHT
jgi:hypothetical protein